MTRTFQLIVIAAVAALASNTAIATSVQQPTGAASAAEPFKVHAIDPILELGSPDGKWAIWRKDDAPRSVWLRDLGTGRDRNLVTLAEKDFTNDLEAQRGMAWSRDSRHIALSFTRRGHDNAEIHVLSVPDGRDQILTMSGDALAWTNRGELLVRNLRPATAGVPGLNTWWLVPMAGGEARAIYTDAPGNPGWVLSITPDGRTLLLESLHLPQDRYLALRDLETGLDREFVRMPGVGNPVVSVDGRLVAFSAKGSVYVAPLEAAPVKNPVRIAQGAVFSWGEPAMWWTADGQLVVPNVVYAESTNLYRVDIDPKTGHPQGSLRLLVRNADHPAVSPDSLQVAYSASGRQAPAQGLLDAAGGPERLFLAGSYNFALGWRSPSVIVMYARSSVTTFDIKTSSQSTNFDSKDGRLVEYVPARDEVLLEGRTPHVLKAGNLATGVERVIATIDDWGELSASCDGQFIAYSRRLRPFPTSGSELRVMGMDGVGDRLLMSSAWRRGSHPSVDPAAWSPDGKYLLFDDYNAGELRILDVATRQSWPLSVAPYQPDRSNDSAGASWAPDGSFVVVEGDADWKDPVGKVFEGVTYDAIAKLRGDGKEGQGHTKVALLGTGTPNPDPDRFGPAVAVVVDDQSYLVDAGVGVVRRAAATGIRALTTANLQRVFVTHLHSDHTLGLPDLMFSPWAARSTPLDVYGPSGIEDMTTAIEKAWQADIEIRTNGGQGLASRNYRAITHTIKAGRIYEDAKVKIDAIPVPHGTWPEAFGFRFETADRVVVISGDTRPAASIVDACNGCDLLIHEVYSLPSDAKREAYFKAFHTSTTELAEIATKAHPRLLVLYHTLGAGPDALVAQIRAAGYKGLVVVAQDLDVY